MNAGTFEDTRDPRDHRSPAQSEAAACRHRAPPWITEISARELTADCVPTAEPPVRRMQVEVEVIGGRLVVKGPRPPGADGGSHG